MNVARLIGDAIVNPPERRSPRWWVSRIVPPTAAVAEFAMAVATLLRHTDLGRTENLLTAAKLLDNVVSATHVDPAVTLAVLAISHIGGNRIMALLETLLKPLLNAQLEAGLERGEAIGEARGEAIGEARGEAIGEARGEAIGEARGELLGRAKAEAEFEEWKAQQRAAGAQFVDDELPEEPDTTGE